MQIFDISQN